MITQKNQNLDFNLFVEDRFLSGLRADQADDKLRRVIDTHRETAEQTGYTVYNKCETKPYYI